MRLLFIFSFLLTSLLSQAGEHQVKTITSRVLGQKRALYISLPENYSALKQYPVSYVLDAESLFISHKNVVEYLSKKKVIPEMIVVGIVNSSRSFDLTHIADSTSNFKPNGGGQGFQYFLTHEVVPYIDSNYATSSYKLLTGHSISGLFAAKLLANENPFFNAYLLLDPALWWADMEVFSSWKKSTLESEKCYLAIANSLPTDIKSVKVALQDTSTATIGIRSVIACETKLKSIDKDQSNWQSEYYENENHGSIPMVSVYNGLKFIFDYYKKPSFQTLTDSSHIVLENHYQMVSEKLGYTVLPSASDLSGLAWRSMELEKNNDRGFSFLELYIKHYPNDAAAYVQMGQYYNKIGNQKKAKTYFEKSMSVTDRTSDN